MAKAPQTYRGIENAEYSGLTADVLAARLAGACAARGWIIVSPVAPQVVCEDEELSRLWELVNALSGRRTSARSLVKFTLVPSEAGVRVQAGIFTEETGLFGQASQRQPETSDELAEVLAGVGGSARTTTPATPVPLESKETAPLGAPAR